MQLKPRIAPCLWFDSQAEQAAAFYISVFKNSRIVSVSRYGDAGREIHQRPAGAVMALTVALDRQPFPALNGGRVFKFNEAVSLQVFCENQKEIDFYWNALSTGGDPRAQQCGWLKDQFGLSWQVVPAVLNERLKDYNSETAQRALDAMLHMKKLDIAELERVAVA